MKKSWRILFICVIAALLAVGGGSSDDTTQGASMPEFLFSYPDNWRNTRNEAGLDYEWNVIQNERGIEINYYSLDGGFGSPYYGGNKILNCVHITKVCETNGSIGRFA